MKTAISLPNDLFVLANEFAKVHGMSRSELYATALRTYIHTHSRANLTARINAVCERLETALPEDLSRRARQNLLDAEW